MSLFKILVRKTIPDKLIKKIKRLLYLNSILKPLEKRICPICNYNGYFAWFGTSGNNIRIDAQCPNCLSLERHRFIHLLFSNKKILKHIKFNPKTLHFAPEKQLRKTISSITTNYSTADLFNNEADMILDIQDTKLQANTYDLIIVNHVFEHVPNDKKAFSEISRILNQEGTLITSVPIINSWEKTYEKNPGNQKINKKLHFGQNDHVRFYGSDFIKRIELSSDLKLKEIFIAEGDEVINYGLNRGEQIFIFKKN